MSHLIFNPNLLKYMYIPTHTGTTPCPQSLENLHFKPNMQIFHYSFLPFSSQVSFIPTCLSSNRDLYNFFLTAFSLSVYIAFHSHHFLLKFVQISLILPYSSAWLGNNAQRKPRTPQSTVSLNVLFLQHQMGLNTV